MAERPTRRAVRVGVGVLVVHQGLLLLGRRRAAPGAGTWSPPTTRLAYGEDFVDAAARALREQAGLSARSQELGPYTNDRFADAREQVVTVFVVARGITGTPVNLDPQACEGWAWFRWGAWPAPLFAPVASLLEIGWRPGGA